MSASSKKKLRKEQNAAAMTERQIKEQREAKKLARNTTIFIVVMALLVTAGIGVLLRNPINTLINRNTDAITIGEYTLNAVEFNYYYADAVQDFYSELKSTYGNQTSIYAQLYYGVNFSAPLDEQAYGTSDQTWGDYFVQIAKANARSVYALYHKAIAENHKVSEKEQDNIDITEMSLDFAAQSLGYSSTDAYVAALYGPGADVESYARYFEMNTIASSYFAAYGDSLTYVDKDYRDYETDKYHDFSSVSYHSYTIGMGTYLTGGTPDANGNKVYSDEERAAALKAAKADADALLAAKIESIEDFDKAIAALEINKDKKDVKSTENKNVLLSKVSNEDAVTWLTDPERKDGDMTIIEVKNTTTDADGKETSEVTGYYVLYFQNLRDNTQKLANVRHLLVKFQGGTKDKDGKTTVYSDEEKAAAEKKARDLLAQWQAGEKVDEESFIALVKEKTDDTGTKSNGGLIEDIHPDSNLVENFLNWCLEEHLTGDVDVVESEYGFHIMYYVGNDELSYRDILIKDALIERDMENWITELEKPYTVTDANLSRVYYDFMPS